MKLNSKFSMIVALTVLQVAFLTISSFTGLNKMIQMREYQVKQAKTINGKAVKPRIDAMGMQSHVSFNWPGVQGYENAIKTYLQKGINIHVTEFDINKGNESESADLYGEYFKMLKKYGKTCTEYEGNHIECVTLWGINNSTSWIYNETKYPLIFNNFKTTKAFWKVINAAK